MSVEVVTLSVCDVRNHVRNIASVYDAFMRY